MLVKYDKATKDVISDVTYRIADLESRKVGILEQQTLSKALLNLLVNRDLDREVRVDQRVLREYEPFDQDLNDLKIMARDGRTELKQLELSEGINDLNSTRIKKEGNPELAVFAGIGLQTENFSFDGGGPLYTTGINMKMNILDGGLRKKKVEQLQFEKEKIENNRAQFNQKIDIELTQLFYQIRTIESQIASAESALLSAEESYKILKTKYENDKLLLIELLQAENRITSTKLQLDILKYDHLIKKAEIQKAIEAEN